MSGKNKAYIILLSVLLLGLLAGLLDLGRPPLPKMPFKLGLDLQGGTHLIYEADLSNMEPEDYSSSMSGLRDVIERRVNLFGVAEPVVQRQETGGSHRLIVELAGIADPALAIEEIGKTPFLEFREQKPEEEIEKIRAKQQELEGKTEADLENIENWELAFEDPFLATELTGKYLEGAEVILDQNTFQPQVSLQFSKEGGEIFEELTARNIGKPLAIYIDGIIISAPIVQGKISGGRGQITGQFTIEEAQTLARNLNAGALPVPITLISQQTVGPILGAVSLERSLKAGIVGLLAVILFLTAFYRLPGLLAASALLFYVTIILALFKVIPVTLTLSGVAGFILSIGMAIDANILIFSRLREELAGSKNFSAALEESFRRAWPSIRDGSLTTLIVALILFGFGTSFVKGFALVLSIGIICSIFSAVFVTKNILRLFAGTKLEKMTWLWE